MKEQPEGFNYTDWANVGLAAQKLEGKEFAAGTVAVWKGSYWDLYEPDDGSGAEPEQTEEEIRAEQEAAREKAALEELYRSLIGFVASGAFTMHDDLKRIVCEARVQPVVVADAIGGDPSFETDKRIASVREEFMARLGTSGPSEYEAGFRLMAAARDMVRLNSSYSGDDAEGWLEHWELFRSAGFEPGGDDEWLMERVQASAKEEEKDE